MKARVTLLLLLSLIIISLTIVNCPFPEIVYDNPLDPNNSHIVAAWFFDGDSKDSSANGRDLTPAWATVAPNYSTVQGRSCTTLGPDGYFYINEQILDGTEFTVTFWQYHMAAVAGSFFSTHNTGTGFKIFSDAGSQVDIEVNSQLFNNIVDISLMGRWRHYAVVMKGSSLKVYVDNMKRLDGTMQSSFPTMSSFRVGKNLDSTGQYTASLDNIRVFNKALTEEQLTTIYNHEK